MEQNSQPLAVTKRRAAAELSVCVRTVDHLLATKQLSCRRVGRKVLIPFSSLVSFLRHDHPSPARRAKEASQ